MNVTRQARLAAVGTIVLALAMAVVLLLCSPRTVEAVWIVLRSAVLALAALGLLRGGSNPVRRAALVVAVCGVITGMVLLAGFGYQDGLDASRLYVAASVVGLLWVPVAGYGIYRIPSRRRGAGGLEVLVDSLVAGSALIFISWLLLLRPMLGTPNVSYAEASHLLFLAGNATVIAMAVASMPHAGPTGRRSLAVFVVAMLATAGVDLAMTFEWVHRMGGSLPWAQLGALAALGVASAGAFKVAPEKPERSRSGEVVARYLAQAPLAAVVVVAIVFLASGRSFTIDEVFPAVLMLAAILVRQLLYARDAANNHPAAMSDDLTGLASRKAFLEHLAGHLSTEDPGLVAVAVVNIDGFKEINDGFGHEVGDDVLNGFAALLSRTAKAHLAARLGADEFAVLLAGATASSEALSVAAKLARTCVVETTRGIVVPVDPSVGVAIGLPGDQPSCLLRRADIALRSAKGGEQRRRYAFFRPSLQSVASRRHRLAACMAGAGERGELTAVFQPLVDLRSGAVVGAEALLRWRHPIFGEVLPTEFIPIAEETGHIEELGDWILSEALSHAARWRRHGRGLDRLLVNVSVRQLDPTFPARVASALADAGLPEGTLTLEVTETHFASPQAESVLHGLRDAGVRLAIDDFGTGYSNLAKLIHLPADVLKLDREFMAGVDSARGGDVFRTVAALADTLGLATVAEGIETDRHYRMALEAGVTFGQGHYLSAPVLPRKMEPMLPLCQPKTVCVTGARPTFGWGRSEQSQPAED